jgi:hypothetical protein
MLWLLIGQSGKIEVAPSPPPYTLLHFTLLQNGSERDDNTNTNESIDK